MLENPITKLNYLETKQFMIWIPNFCIMQLSDTKGLFYTKRHVSLIIQNHIHCSPTWITINVARVLKRIIKGEILTNDGNESFISRYIEVDINQFSLNCHQRKDNLLLKECGLHASLQGCRNILADYPSFIGILVNDFFGENYPKIESTHIHCSKITQL